MDRRAAKVQGDVLTKLRKLDRGLGGVRRGDVGPMEQRLLDLGGVKPLVMGGYGGVNREWVELIDTLAARAAPEQQDLLLCPSVRQCESVLRVRLDMGAVYDAEAGAAGRRIEELRRRPAGGGGTTTATTPSSTVFSGILWGATMRKLFTLAARCAALTRGGRRTLVTDSWLTPPFS